MRFQLPRFGLSVQAAQEIHIVLSYDARIGVQGTQLLLADRQRPLVERLGLRILALVTVEVRQVVEPDCQGGMLEP